jgi:ParB family chromosome partitioning protein
MTEPVPEIVMVPVHSVNVLNPLIKKATLAQSRLLFIVNALRRLVADEHFTTLLRAEAIQSMPLPLAERIGMTGGR